MLDQRRDGDDIAEDTIDLQGPSAFSKFIKTEAIVSRPA